MFSSFKYNDHDIKYIKIGDEIWFKAMNVASMLDYKTSATRIISKHISDKDIAHLDDIFKKLGLESRLGQQTTEPPKTLYINESGFNDLTMKSTMPEAVKIKKMGSWGSSTIHQENGNIQYISTVVYTI